MIGVVVTCWTTAVKSPAATPAAAALKIRVLSMATLVTGEAEGVPGVVCGVVEHGRVGEARPEDDQDPETEREERRPPGEFAAE